MNSQQPKRIRSLELDWCERNRSWLEKEHPGKWIAIKGNELIAVGDRLDSVMDEAESRGIDHPLVSGVKRKEFQGIFMIPSNRNV